MYLISSFFLVVLFLVCASSPVAAESSTVVSFGNMALKDGQGDEDSLVDDDSYHDIESKEDDVNDNRVVDEVSRRRKERKKRDLCNIEEKSIFVIWGRKEISRWRLQRMERVKRLATPRWIAPSERSGRYV